jgi:ABC-type tungstate transport system substrate-binding protein
VPDILDTIGLALGLLIGLDTTLLHVVALSLAVSLSACRWAQPSPCSDSGGGIC